METPLKIRRAIEREIQMAFRGVTLGQGISLRQAQLTGRSPDAVSNTHSSSVTPGEIVDDWSQIPLDELERDCIAHLDAGGFRYYIPALMLSVLENYDSASMRVIGTLGSLYPKKNHSWEYHMLRYSLLNHTQKTAIARFLAALPKLVELGYEDHKIAERTLRNYWGEYLQPNPAE
jgi:uncharacterized protein DUF6714